MKYRCLKCDRVVTVSQRLSRHDAICESCGGILVTKRGVPRRVWAVIGAVVVLASVVAGIMWLSGSDDDAWKAEWDRGEREVAAVQARDKQLRERVSVAWLKAAKDMGLGTGAEIEAHGATWRVTKVGGTIWAGMRINVRCSSEVTETQLRAFLAGYRDAAIPLAERFQNVAIFVFHSPAYEAADYQLAYLLTSSSFENGNISINSAILKGLNSPRKERLGLSYETRQQIYAAASQAETAVAKAHSGTFPHALLGAAATQEEKAEVLKQWTANGDLAVELEFANVAKLYGLTAKQLDSIYDEGMENGWLGR